MHQYSLHCLKSNNVGNFGSNVENVDLKPQEINAHCNSTKKNQELFNVLALEKTTTMDSKDQNVSIQLI